MESKMKIVGRVKVVLNDKVILQRKFNAIHDDLKAYVSGRLYEQNSYKAIVSGELINTDPWEAANVGQNYLYNDLQADTDILGKSGIIIATAGPERDVYPMKTTQIAPDVVNPERAVAWKGEFERHEATAIIITGAGLGYTLVDSGVAPLTIADLWEPFDLPYAFTALGDRELLQGDRLTIEWIIQVT